MEQTKGQKNMKIAKIRDANLRSINFNICKFTMREKVFKNIYSN